MIWEDTKLQQLPIAGAFFVSWKVEIYTIRREPKTSVCFCEPVNTADANAELLGDLGF